MKIVSVNTGKPYSVFVGEGLLERTAQLMMQAGVPSPCHIVIVSDDRVAPLYLDLVKQSLAANETPPVVAEFIIPAGESSKNTSLLTDLVEFLAAQPLTRSDLLIALGGGVVGDLTAFAASVYLRGIRCLQIPTTLLAQVDSSVGGKTAVNLTAGKNLMGTFHQPCAVICDTATLSTLSPEIFSDGMAEVIKYACIGDAALFAMLADASTATLEQELLTEVILRCIQRKADIVSQDETEQGLRMTLNFGHTLGHAVEKHYRYARYTHGQAVAIGMVALTARAESLGLTEAGTTGRLRSLLHQFDLPTRCPLSTQRLFELCAVDKKNHGDTLTLVLLKTVGESFFHPVSRAEFRSLLDVPVSEPKTATQLTPPTAPLAGMVRVPPSKSILHRTLIAAALADGTSRISGCYLSDDILATLDLLERLGASFLLQGEDILVTGVGGSTDSSPLGELFCHESGSTIRFLIPVVAALGRSASFGGAGRLVERPLGLYEEVLAHHGVSVTYAERLPFAVEGQLRAGDYRLAGDVSSQFVSGLLFALPRLEGDAPLAEDSTITVTPPFESQSYVDMTLKTLRAFGIVVQTEQVGENVVYRIPARQRYHPCDYVVESDYSQAAFFLIANALGAKISLKQFAPPTQSTQGDAVICEILAQAGVKVSWADGVLTGSISNDSLQAFEIDASDCPDLVPILCLLASQCVGDSSIRGVHRLTIKESDRIASTRALLESLGGTLHYDPVADVITIPGEQHLTAGRTPIDSHNDHRIAMLAAIAATILPTGSPAITLFGGEAVQKSYPTFFQDYRSLGGIAHVIDLASRH